MNNYTKNKDDNSGKWLFIGIIICIVLTIVSLFLCRYIRQLNNENLFPLIDFIFIIPLIIILFIATIFNCSEYIRTAKHT